MGLLIPQPRTVRVDGSGSPYAGALRNVYLPGTTTRVTLYGTKADADAATNAIANPVVADSNGEFPPVYVADSITSVRLVDTTDTNVQLSDDDSVPINQLTQSSLGRILYPQTTDELAAGVTPTNYGYPPGAFERYGATGDGSADDAPAILSSLAANRIAYPYSKAAKTWKVASQILVPIGSGILGHGCTSNTVLAGATRILRGFAGSAATIVLQDDSWLDQLDIDNNNQGTGECWQVKGTRCRIGVVSWRKSGGDGARIGATETTASTFNANLWRIDHGIALENAGKALYVHHVNTDTSATYPQGLPDVNAGLLTHIDARLNGDGVVVENAIDCTFVNVVSQVNTGKGLWLKANARGHKFFGVYTELNGVELQIDSGAKKNTIRGNRFTTTDSQWVINETDNDIVQFDAGLEGGATWYQWKRHAVLDAAAAGEALYDFIADTGKALYAQIGGKKDAGAGGIITVRTRNTSGTKTDRLTINETGDAIFKNQSNGTLFGGKTAFNTTTTGTWIDGTTGRVNIVNSGAGVKTVAAWYDASGAAGSITTNGSGTATYATTSDARRKDIVGAYAPGDTVDRINVYDFTWKHDGSADVGVIAQELAGVCPNAVVVGGDDVRDEPWSVDYSKLVPLLLAEVKALRARVAALESAP